VTAIALIPTFKIKNQIHALNYKDKAVLKLGLACYN
jgi:hypothetical protein